MALKYIFSIIVKAWFGLVFFQGATLYFAIGADNRSSSVDEKFPHIVYDQRLFFITVYNAIIVTLFFLIRTSYIITIGIPIGAMLIFVSEAGELIDYFNNSESIYSIILKNFFNVAFISFFLNSGLRNLYVKNFEDCSEFYAFIEVAILSFLIYYFLYSLLLGIHIIVGCICWDSKNKVRNSIFQMKFEKENIRNKFIHYANGLNDKLERRSRIKKAILLIPTLVFIMIIMFLQYCVQLWRNILVLVLSLIERWINKKRESTRIDKLILYKRRAKQFSIIFVLCGIYIWMNFENGAESVITKIIQGILTIIVIPIAINRFTSNDMS